MLCAGCKREEASYGTKLARRTCVCLFVFLFDCFMFTFRFVSFPVIPCLVFRECVGMQLVPCGDLVRCWMELVWWGSSRPSILLCHFNTQILRLLLFNFSFQSGHLEFKLNISCSSYISR
jgi:hypothetical protein